ncbi:MAG TPA: hypothetical protein PKD31_27880, partial [Blastocatellia bacterium]|nr:hypothetical protein [Blastocatellia bacterium]
MLFCLFAVLFLSAATVQAQTPSEQGIPLLEIATRAEQIKRPLRELAARLSPNSELEPIVGQLNIEEAQLDAQAKQIEERIAATPTLYELRELERDWRMRSQEISRW